MSRINGNADAYGLCFALLLAASSGACGGGSKKVAVDARVPEVLDAGAGDGGSVDAQMPPLDAGTRPPDDAYFMPTKLSETGLYAPGSTSELADGVTPYSVRYMLWADGAEKQRWLLLPPDAQIDTSDMDAWVFPIGTKVWKEFSVAGKRLETRLLWKHERGWYRMAFEWNEDGSDAIAARGGKKDIAGTTHDIPSRTACRECHDGSKDTLLGVSAIQLSHDQPGISLQGLAADGRLTHAPSQDFRLPDTMEWNALGYLHANCGSCHNPASITWDRLDLDLLLRTNELSAVSATRSYKSSVGAHLTELGGDLELRVAAGDAAHSGLLLRMTTRGSEKAMPPLASEVVDAEGVALIREWIDSL